MKEKYINYRSAKLFYRTVGIGQTVVLLHGFGEDGNIWQHQIEFLQKDFHLIIPDIPGSGNSSFLGNTDIDGYAEVVKFILDTEGLTKDVIFFGHSMGGYIALAFAEKYPQYLKAFGLIHSSSFADSEEKKIARYKAIAFIEKNGSEAFLNTGIPGLFSEEFNKTNKSIVDALVKKGNDFSPEALIQYYQAMIARPDRTDVLKNTPNPVLFVIGEFDQAVPKEQSLQQCFLPQKSQVTILYQSAHMGMLEETEKTNEALLKFLNFVE